MPEARRLMARKENQINNAKEQISNTIEGNSLHNKYLYSKIPFIELINEHTLYLRIPSFLEKRKVKLIALLL